MHSTVPLRLVSLLVAAACAPNVNVSTVTTRMDGGADRMDGSGGFGASGGTGGFVGFVGVDAGPAACEGVVPPNSGSTSGDLNVDGGLDLDSRGVCGCDGELYASADEASQVGVAVDRYDYCRIPSDQFGCGTERCSVGEQGCWVEIVLHWCCEPNTQHCIDIDQACMAAAATDEERCQCFVGATEGCRIYPLGNGLAVYYDALVGP